MDQNSAEAIENSVDSAETIQKPQLGIADKPEESVDSNEPTEQSSDYLMSALLGEEEEPDGKVIPEGQYLKLKAANKSMKQELERLRSQFQQPVEHTQQPVATQIELPKPDDFEDGVHDPKYQAALLAYQQDVISRTVTEQLKKKSAELEANAYLSKYQERLDKTLPIANHRIEELKSKDPEFKERMSRPFIQQVLANLPMESLVTIAESDSPESIVNYYTLKPERLLALQKNNVDELVNLGKIIGKIQGIKSSRKTSTDPIKPIKAVDNTAKLHPLKDYAKYDHNTVEGHKAWERDLEKLNRR